MDDKQEKNFFIVDSSAFIQLEAYIRRFTGLMSMTLWTHAIRPLCLSRLKLTGPETQTGAIEAAFQEYTEDRKDIAILLINQHVGVKVR